MCWCGCRPFNRPHTQPLFVHSLYTTFTTAPRLLPHTSSPPLPQLKATELSQLRTQLQALARKQTGSLAVRDLSDLVRPEQVRRPLLRGGGSLHKVV